MAINAVKYLPQYGWEPIILSAKHSQEFGVDLSIPNDPSDLVIIRTYSWESVFVRLVNKLGLIPDAMFGWMPFAVRAIKSIDDLNQVKVIISRSNPITSHLVARRIRQYLSQPIPWVVMFGDPWAYNPYIQKLPVWIKRYRQQVEANIIQEADAIVVTTERTRQLFINQYGRSDKFHVLPNTYDPAIFKLDNITPVQPVLDRPLTMTYAGSLYGVRSPEPLFQTLKLLIDKSRIAPHKIRLKLIGSIGEFANLIHEYGLETIIEVSGKLPHSQTIKELAQSDVLVLIDAPADTDSIFLPAKLVEYLAFNKPILGITPKGESADLIDRAQVGVAIDPREIEQIANAIEKYYNEFYLQQLRITPARELIEVYRADKYDEKMSQLLAKVTGQ